MSLPAKRGRKAWVPPQGVDWARPAMQIGNEYGVCAHTVISWLRRHGLPVRPKGHTAWIPPEGIDWSRPASHIAEECGAATTTVIRWMRRNNLPVRPTGLLKGIKWSDQRKRDTRRLDPALLDWTCQDTALAKAHGCCRERIRQLRKAAGLPASGSSAWLLAGGVVTHPQYSGINKSQPPLDCPPAVA
jgi:hypothetical protein